MGILGMIAEKKQIFRNKLEAYQDKATIKRADKLEALTKERLRQEKVDEMKRMVANEKAAIRQAKYGRATEKLKSITKGINKIKKKKTTSFYGKRDNPFNKQTADIFKPGETKDVFSTIGVKKKE